MKMQVKSFKCTNEIKLQTPNIPKLQILDLATFLTTNLVGAFQGYF